ncbi:MAG: DUF2314 domain-containing protein [Planctomycetota bacterium]
MGTGACNRLKQWLRPPGGDVTWLSIFCCAISLIALWGGIGTKNPAAILGGLVLLVLSLGWWFRQAWARWTGLVMCIGAFVARCTLLATGSRSVRWTSIVISALAAWILWKWEVRKDDEAHEGGGRNKTGEGPDSKPFISLVLLIKEPRQVDDVTLARLASKAWGATLKSGQDGDNSATDFVVGKSPIFMCRFQDMFFTIHNHAAPYFPPEVAEETRELRLKKALSEHRAWLSVDLVSSASGKFDESMSNTAYPLIGKLVAELADSDCLAIYCPETRQMNIYDPEIGAQLRGRDPLSGAFKQANVPVWRVGSDDPRLIAAVAEARRRWPEFQRAFEQRAPGQMFSVKARVADGKNAEYMWMKVSAIEHDDIYGTLDNDPVNVTGVKLGDRFHVKVTELSDWMYLEGKDLRGGFTVKVLRDAAQKG